MTRRLQFGIDTPLFTDALSGGDDPYEAYGGAPVDELINVAEDSWQVHRYVERTEALYPGLGEILQAIERSDRHRTADGNSTALRGAAIALYALALAHKEYDDSLPDPEDAEPSKVSERTDGPDANG